ncbi:Ig-like domain-containing protein [Aureliella helgolandensis]|uniref:peptidylprolyl isomerase n=1 Tax=Aureliella helgolandensis TaxID=2527968 RepID=A0A518GFX2_9BACT|nr:tandem-95 repeat protein [Aureliella helgolandensis]QDV27493.1 Putative peptidyl-prolyl cis-trans isomerase [Aureliella helgolandensis]
MTRREKRQRFSQWLAEMFGPSGVSSGMSRRTILVEPLESRQLMAGDGFMSLLGITAAESSNPDTSSASHAVVAEGELSGEGEDAIDLVAFAKALTDSGTRFYGASWCEFCTAQKQLFEDGYKYLPFIEVTNADRTPNAVATTEGIIEYPTWEFPDSTRLTGVQSLQTLATRAGITIPLSSTPSVADLPNVTVGLDSPLHVPVDAYDANGNPLTITVTSSDPSILTAEVLTGNQSLKLAIDGYGDMVFELFEDKAPLPTGRVISLANDGFYDGISFHRVVNNFVIQGGDPTGTGSGGSTLGDFDDQYHLDLQHNASGILSFAKSSDDTNDSQFFITEGPQRFLDFQHSVFGILTEGEAVREAISNTATNASDKPINAVTIDSATVFSDTENGVLFLKPTGNGSGPVTITVNVADGEGNTTTKTFTATVAADVANGAPFLNPIPSVETSLNTPVTVNLSSQDAENDTRIYSVQALGSTAFDVTVDSATGVATVTPPTGFTGQLQFRATVRQTTTPTTSSPDDNQVVTVTVTSQSVPTGIDLSDGSDSGISATDNITNSQTLVFNIAGTEVGATVEVRSGGNVVGSAVATGATTAVTVTNVSGLGEGAALFTATQTLNGSTSGESPSLSVVLDRTLPEAASTAGVPANAIVGQPITANLEHSEEGQGLVYSLNSPPTGVTINAQTGQISWTPTAEQLGAHTLEVVLTDPAGNVTNQNVPLNVIEQPQVKFSLVTVDMSGQPITTIAAGQNFKVQVVVDDVRDGADATGVFAAYLDLLFDSAVIEPIATNPISRPSPYTQSPSGSLTTAGLIDELGAFSSSTERLGSDPRVLVEVTFLAKAAGNANLRTEAADASPAHDVLLYDQSSGDPTDRVEYGKNEFAVGANFELEDDVFNFDEDSGASTLDVLTNDSVTGGAVLTIASVGNTSGGGTVTVASDGKTLVYTPAANFNGAETFTYTAQNQEGVQRTATVTVQVTDINDPPVALNDTFSVVRNSNQNVLEVLANDSTGVDDSNSETLTISAVSTGSAGGTIQVGPSGLTLRYTPLTGFQGSETFTYTLSDGRGGTDTGTVSVSVDLQNPPPTPVNDSFTVAEDAAQASFDVLANDSSDDPDETLSVSAVGVSKVGSTVTVSSDGLQVLYKPGANFSGTEILTYTLRDSGGATSDGLMTFTVTPVNDAPDAVDDTLTAVSSAASSPLDVLANDLNPDAGEVLTITAVSQPPSGKGTIAIATDGKSLVYTSPNSTFEGDFAVTYTISDGNGMTDTATVNVAVRNFLPRQFSGKVTFGDQAMVGGFINGLELSLTGTDTTGATVSKTTTVGSDGSYAFPDLAPGSYTLTRAAQPFLHDDGSVITINSAATDGDVVNDMTVSGGLRPQFFGIRDFLGSQTQSSVWFVLDSAGAEQGHFGYGDWANVDDLGASLIEDRSTLLVTGTNTAQQNLTASVPINGSQAVHVSGQASGSLLLRIEGGTTAINLAPPATATTAAASSLSAEGEGAAAVPSSPTIQGVNWGASRSDSSSEESSSGIVQRELANPEAAASVMSGAAVDSAMAAVMPALQLRLSEALSDSLTADGEQSLEVNDGLIAGL